MKERVWLPHRRLGVRPAAVAGLAALALFALGGLVDASNGLLPLANGPKAGGRAGVDFAIARDATALNTNPAGLVQLPNGTRTDSPFNVFYPLYEYEDDNDAQTSSDIAAIPSFGIVWTMGRPDIRIRHDDYLRLLTPEEKSQMQDVFMPPNDFKSKIAFGFGMFVQGGGGNHAVLKTRLFPEGVTFATKFGLISATPGVAIQITDSLSLGVAFNINYGDMKLNAALSQQADLLKGPAFEFGGQTLATYGDLYKVLHALPPPLGNSDNITEVNGRAFLTDLVSWGFGGRIGMMWKPSDQVTVGATYIPHTWMADFKGKAKVDYTREIDATPPFLPGLRPGFLTRSFVSTVLTGDPNTLLEEDYLAFYDATIKDFEFPEQIALGVAIQVNPRLLVAADYKYVSWNKEFRKFTSVLSNGSDQKINLLVGSDTIEAVVPLNWQDQEVFSVGVEYQIDDEYVVRAGYNYADNMIPANTILPILPAFVEAHASLGFGYQYDNWEFDMAWEHGFVNTVRTQQHLLTVDLQNSKSRLIQEFIYLGASYKF
ncbi:MAG: outer membrane protein transport protein [Planctomycetes bacterium]|nr:outer membrane protein transport protein [Planctomycetota bacterium]